MKKTGLLLIGLLILLSCGSKAPQKVVIENRYSMEVPETLVKATDLNKEASLQYQNIYLEFYVIVIDETKKEVIDAIVQNNLTADYTQDFNGYSKLILDNYTNSIKIKEKSDVTDFTVNGLKAKKMTIEGTYENIDAFFYLALIEGKDRFYQIMTWTLQTKKNDFSADMEKMINSFTEL